MRHPDPIASRFCGESNLGVISEAMDDLINNYYDTRYVKRFKPHQMLNKEEVVKSLNIKALHSRVNPGEAVGALCAQVSIMSFSTMAVNVKESPIH